MKVRLLDNMVFSLRSIGRIKIINRESTIECLEDTILGCLNSGDYKELFESYEKILMKNNCDFLQKINFFNNIR